MRRRAEDDNRTSQLPEFRVGPLGTVAGLEGVEYRGSGAAAAAAVPPPNVVAGTASHGPGNTNRPLAVSTPTKKMEGGASPSSKPAVHPYAQKLAGLLSPMSIRDQEVASQVSTYLIFSSLIFSFPVAFWMENILISAGAITLAGVICFILFLPNWRQRKDPEMQWVSRAEVYYYYKKLEARRAEMKTSGEKAKAVVAPIPDMPETEVFAPVPVAASTSPVQPTKKDI